VRLSFNSLEDIVQACCHDQTLVPGLFSVQESAHVFFILDPSLAVAYVGDSLYALSGFSASDVVKYPIQNILVESAANTHFLQSIVRERFSDETEKLVCDLRTAKGGTKSVSFSVQTICSEVAILGYSCLGTLLRTQSGNSMAAPYLLRADEDPQQILDRWNSLGECEQELIILIVNGVQNKVAASRMGVAIRTIESRRSASMKKLGVRSVADLVRIYLAIHLI
jgi:DNA-binding CsgD family transcriptional regulator